MSKKMMKRSLALGALMAFVITGSAMAAELATNESLTGTMNGNNESYTLDTDVVTLSSTVENTLIKDATIAVDAGKTLNLISKASGGDWNGVINNGVTITGDGIINIKQEAGSGNAIGSRTQQQDIVNITANTVYADVFGNGSAIYAENEDKVTINAKEITLIGKKGDLNGGGNAAAIYATGKVEIKGFDNLTLSVTNATTDKTEGGPAVIANGTDAKVTITGANVTASSEGRSAIVANGGTVTMKVASLDATANNLEGGTGIRKNSVLGAEGTGATLNITVTDSMTVNGDSSVTAAVGAKGGASVTVDGTADLVINGTVRAEASKEGTNVNIKGQTITIDAGGSRGVNVVNGTATDVQGTATVTLGDTNTQEINIKNASYGILVQYNGTAAGVEVKGAKLNITDSGVGIWAMNGNLDDTDGSNNAQVNIGAGTITTIKNVEDAIYATSQASVNIEGDLYASGTNSVIGTRGDSVVNVNADNSDKVTVQLDGNIVYDYTDHKVDSNVTVNLANSDSWLKGSIINTAPETAGDDAKVTGMSLGLSNGATWYVTGNSFVNNLTANEGKIAFKDNSHVHVDAGSGSLILTEDGKTADDLNTAAQLTTVAEKLGVGKEAKDIEAKVVMAEGNVKGETTGVVSYEEVKGTDGYYHGYVAEDAVTEKVNTKNQAIGEAAISMKLHWRSHMNDMNKRMGELRNANGEHGVWTRMVRGENEYEGTKAQYNQYQLGYDEKLSVDKRWTVGAAVTFAEGDANYSNGSTDDKSTAFAIYGSKLNNDGTFVDLIARYARLESDFEDVTSGKGDYSTNGMSVSAEFGKRIEQGNGLWIEPQVELTYGTVDSAEFQLGGKTVKVGDMDSLIGRVGFSIGKDIKQGNVYARASYLYDFDGETENAFSATGVTRTIEEDLGGGWWEVGVGANINLSKATYIYADVEKTFGGEVDTNWQWNLGVRYSF